MLAFSLWLVLANWHDIKGAYFTDLASFRSAEGTIVSSSMYTSTRRGKTYYHYSIEYEFTVNGKSYRSDEITFNDNYRNGQEFAQTYIDKYPVGKTAVVYYDPYDPSFCVLEPEKKGDAALKLFFLAISVCVFVLSSGYLLIRKMFFSTKLSPQR